MTRRRDDAERELVKAALGRIFGMMSRTGRDGDLEEYERCRSVVLDALELAASPFGHVTIGISSEPSYARDHKKIGS